MRTRIKICGLTRAEDVDAAINAGVDAIGFVFYPPSPRNLAIEQAAALAARVPPFVTRVGLFVNENESAVKQALAAVALDLLQFHGEESEAYCCSFGRPYIKVARVRPGLDLVEFARSYPSAAGLLLDSYVEGYGGKSETFDWSIIPSRLPLPVILSGGLHGGNVAAAIRQLHPWAVDVSSGVESSKGIKNAAKIADFVTAVTHADSLPIS
ncbi:N-(5'-phosphoribosyl)anthranilate isomerase [Georgfuchsia toluolica]|uniref:N-(5'-phosphoribosyl)anthranilate isomerase n=1 Tax=Georgfuchsia toluolica TaxID=424218 RepID=A0A916J2L9_9PROT|nr:phosphoribosylanthranilate isomerase [Georgfuchsia toluolica]CAG4883447.1 N-(5'-phosphoribosyl)anthranilate isomerase [Georgfuchsia toluolica]